MTGSSQDACLSSSEKWQRKRDVSKAGLKDREEKLRESNLFQRSGHKLKRPCRPYSEVKGGGQTLRGIHNGERTKGVKYLVSNMKKKISPSVRKRAKAIIQC